MIRYPSRSAFRWLAFIALGLQVCAYAFSLFGFHSGGQHAADALAWCGYGSVLPYKVVYIWGRIYPILFIIGLLFLALLQGWARYFLLCLILISVLLIPFSGLSVTDSFTGFTFSLANLAYWIPFLLSFFRPCADYFDLARKA
jgi:hypothetical protein